MIIIAIVISIVFLFILGMIIKAYYDDIIELESRILQLEKRLEEYKTQYKSMYNQLEYGLQTRYEEIFVLQKRVEKIERKGKKKDERI